MPCYQSEYEQWRGAVEDLHSIHARALRFVRANNVPGVRRTDKQRRGAMKRLNKALTSIAGCVPSEPDTADARPSGNPLVGTWKTVQRFVSEDGVNVTHDTSTKFTRDGRFLARIKRDDFCRKNGLGFLPLTVEGAGRVRHGWRPPIQLRWSQGVLLSAPWPVESCSLSAVPTTPPRGATTRPTMSLTGVQGGGNWFVACQDRQPEGLQGPSGAALRAPVSRFLPREVAGEQTGGREPQPAGGHGPVRWW